MALQDFLPTLSGLEVDRPAAPDKVGLHYFATDTGVLTIWNGATWRFVSSGVDTRASSPVVFFPDEGADTEPGLLGIPTP